MINEHKTFHCTGKNITAHFTDTKKHFVMEYDTKSLVTENIQLYGNTYNGIQFQDKVAQRVADSTILSEFQNKLYKDALHGLKMYSKKELATMPERQRTAIERAHNKAQRILNLWRQTIVNKQVDDFLLALFPHSKMIKEMAECTEGYTNNDVQNEQSFTDLGIDKIQIINKLIQEKILPGTFFNL